MGMCGGGLCLCRAGRFVRVHGTAMVFKIMRVAAVSVELWSDGGLVYGVSRWRAILYLNKSSFRAAQAGDSMFPCWISTVA